MGGGVHGLQHRRQVPSLVRPPHRHPRLGRLRADACHRSAIAASGNRRQVRATAMRSRLHVLAAVSLLVCATALVVGSALAGPPWAPEIGSPPASTGTIVTPDGILGEGVGLATTNDGKGLWVADRRRNELADSVPTSSTSSAVCNRRSTGTSRRRLRRPSRHLPSTRQAVPGCGHGQQSAAASYSDRQASRGGQRARRSRRRGR